MSAWLMACGVMTGPDQPASSFPYSQRLIIQFKPQQARCDATGIASLAKATGISLALVRSMDRGACVVNQFAIHPEHFLRQQNRIAAHDSVQWVEPDQRMYAY